MIDLTQYAQLGGIVVTVVLFLRYLTTRDNKWTDSLKASSDSNVILARALQRLTDTVIKNTSVVEENIPVVSKNTGAVQDNTDTIKKNGK